MAQISNLSFRDITLPSGHVVPRLGAITTDNANLRMIDNARALPAMIGAGDIAVEYDPDPDPEPQPMATVSIAEPEAPAAPVAVETTAAPIPTETPAGPVDATSRRK